MATQYVRHAVSLTKSTRNLSHVITDVHQIIVVDCETSLDFAQSLRLAGYIYYDLDTHQVLDRGIVTGTLTDVEIVTLLDYAAKHRLTLYDRDQFIDTLYELLARGVALVNHNLPFDLGCLARSFVGLGSIFYLKLCSCKPVEPDVWICHTHPAIAVHSLTFPKALLYINSDKPYGAILDTMTLGRALLGPGEMSLKGMGTRFKCETVKAISEEHGNDLTSSYLDYTMRDVQATLELFLAEKREYTQHGLLAPISHVMSEASIGKAYLQQLGIPPFTSVHSEVPDWLYPTAMKAYYGARSEVKIRLQPVEIRYADFKSQYPTVNALLGLQDLLLAQHIDVKHVTAGVQRFLNTITLDDLQRPGIWRKLRVLVKFAPDQDIVPTKFSTTSELGDKETGYDVLRLRGGENWYTLCDAVASKLLTGKAPLLLDAVAMYPYGRLSTRKVTMFGDERYSVDLASQDFFTEVINLRTRVKHDLKAASKAGDKDQVTYLDSLQLALKLLANATSYGVLVETRYDKGVEVAGTYYASPVAVHITAGARLLLAIAERLGRDRGLTYAMCDTDSMAYARPGDMSREEFYSLVDEIVAWFNPLSPYADNAALFELEEVNEYQGVNTPLYFLGVSCKRYALYNRLENGQYRLRKVSAHATGRFQFDREIPLPADIPASSVKAATWQYLIWYRAVEQAEKGITDITIPDEAWSEQIVRYQESISTPGKLQQYSYLPGIRPYSFFTCTPATPGSKYRYVMPYTPTHQALLEATPYIAGSLVIDDNPTYDTLGRRFHDFFTHSEAKAANGHSVGQLERRSLDIDQIIERTRTGKKILPTGDVLNQPGLWSDLDVVTSK